MSHYISVADAELILKDYVTALSGKPSIFYNDQKSLADVDENGTVDLFDAQYVLIYCTENTAKKNITWAELIGKEPECNSVVVSLDTLNGWHHKQ